MSEVWTAKDEIGADDEIIAIKIYSSSVDESSLSAEYALMRKFNHPNLVRPDYFGVDHATGSPFMVMKYYVKGSASEIINNNEEAIKESIIAQFIYSASNALFTIQNHESKIIHQDIKPDNFLINDDGNFVLADFGVGTISKATRQISKNSNTFAGSTPYVAPERFNGAPPRFSQDIFSLGVTIYEILTGVLPFQEYGGARLNHGFPVPDLDPAFGYTSRLNLICKRCMDIEPEARPSATDLQEWAQFFIKNGFWPEIPFVDARAIKSEKLHKSTQLIYDRIAIQKLDEIDKNEIQICINNYNEILALSSNSIDVNQKLELLHKLKVEVEYLNQLDAALLHNIEAETKSEAELANIKSKYLQIKDRITTLHFNQKVNEVDNCIHSLKNKKLKTDLNHLLEQSFDDFDIEKAALFVKQHFSSSQSFNERFNQLETKIKYATEYNEVKYDLQIEIAKPIQSLDQKKLKGYLTQFNSYKLYLNPYYLQLVQRKFEAAESYQTANTEYIRLLSHLEQESNSISYLNSAISQVDGLIQRFRSLNDYKNNEAIAERINLLESKRGVLLKQIESIQKNDQEITIKKSKANTLSIEAGKLFKSILKIKNKEKQLESVDEVIQKYTESLNLYHDENTLVELNRVQDFKNNLIKEVKIKEPASDDEILRNADNDLTTVEEYIHKQEYTRKTLKHHLVITERCIRDFELLLSTQSSRVEPKLKKAIELKEIILEELRKRRRAIVFWFYRGAAVLVLLGIIGILFYPKNSGPRTPGGSGLGGTETNATGTGSGSGSAGGIENTKQTEHIVMSGKTDNKGTAGANQSNQTVSTTVPNGPGTTGNTSSTETETIATGTGSGSGSGGGSGNNSESGTGVGNGVGDNLCKKAPSVNLTVNNNLEISLPDNIRLSCNPKDEGGKIVDVNWESINGPDAKIAKTNSDALVTFNQEGKYEFKVTVKDNDGCISASNVKVNVYPEFKIKNLLTNRDKPNPRVKIPKSGEQLPVVLTPYASGRGLSYVWEKISGGKCQLTEKRECGKLIVTDFGLGNYKFRLTITDFRGRKLVEEKSFYSDFNNKENAQVYFNTNCDN
jgi:serine/threonine protein kinase